MPSSRRLPFLSASLLPLLSLLLLTLFTPQTHAIKFALQAYRYPPAKCVWNAAHPNALVIVTANVGPGADQRVDIEIIDSSPAKNVYLSKRNIKGETRLAVTAHSEGEVGVCFRNHLDHNVPSEQASKKSRIIDLDVDIGADAVDYNAIANQESLSGLETEMRKLEGIVKEIVDELGRVSTVVITASTNARVQSFAWFTLASLLGLGVWQIFHLRAFFKRKYLID
ncbi:hypothetical protein EWM64_g9546 [Hericium alpestre]|uniref:GOLD domain-containing protein n=1 Tax=Hericium alpestre TaxID=135208 RepID=A0A4Y9ZIH2_9AGAM|nr:hypothetical protein EWM64_g9546 [Hericium alpestre]